MLNLSIYGDSKMKKLLFISVLFVASIINAQVLNVPSAEYPTIQSAIDSSVAGDTVLVASGEYVENINFNGKNILLASNFIFDSDTSFISNTIINGNNNGSVVTFNSGEDSTAQLVGFTIKNGHALYGAGIFCNHSNPTFAFLKVKENIVGDCGPNAGHSGSGAGIYLNFSNSSLNNIILEFNKVECPGSWLSASGIAIKNCNILLIELDVFASKNDHDNASGVSIDSSTVIIRKGNIHDIGTSSPGGGIQARNSNLQIIESSIYNCTAYARGGGVSASNMENLTLFNVDIYNNQSDKGGGIYVENSKIDFKKLNVFENRAIYNGGGVYIDNCSGYMSEIVLGKNNAEQYPGGGAYFKDSELEITDISVSNNSAYDGGGLYILSSDLLFNYALITQNRGTGSYVTPPNSPAMEIVNCSPTFNKATIAFNSAWHENHSYANILISSGSQPKFVNSIIWWEESSIDKGIQGDAKIFYSNIKNGWEGEGNTSVDPLFINPDSNDYNLSANSPLIDKGTAYFSYNDTVLVDMNESEYLGSAPDMGYYEFDKTNNVAEETHPNSFKLSQNYPNPFNPSTKIEYRIPNSEYGIQNVELKVYDVLGREIANLVNKQQKAGYYEVEWNAVNSSSGVYFYQLRAGDFVEAKKMVLLR